MMKWYSNFWIRNGFVMFFLLCIFTVAQFVDRGERTLFDILKELLPVFCIMYVFICLNNVFLVKRYLIVKRYEIFFLLALFYWFTVIVVCVLISRFLGNFVSLVVVIVNVLFMGFLGTGTYFIHLWIFNDITVREKILVNTVAELDFLKLQLNPHFLLNAMNNLYGESLTRPEETPERILQLSHLLRYQLEATKKEFVSLEQEIDFIKEYFNYYKFRSNNLIVDIEYEGNLKKYQVPPLLYFSLVENAIKFSLQTDTPFVRLRGTELDNHLFFEIENSCLPNEFLQKGTGLGVKNLERRLEVSGLKYAFTKSKTKVNYKTKLELWDLPTNV